MFLSLAVINPQVAGNRGRMVFAPGIFAAFFVVVDQFAAVLVVFHIFGGVGSSMMTLTPLTETWYNSG
nr:hypothetical protein [Haliscomenobacter sp.]